MSLNLKLPRHRWKLWIEINMKLNYIMKIFSNLLYYSEIIPAQSENTTLNRQGIIIKFTLKLAWHPWLRFSMTAMQSLFVIQVNHRSFNWSSKDNMNWIKKNSLRALWFSKQNSIINFNCIFFRNISNLITNLDHVW